jgi:hypothetical protein
MAVALGLKHRRRVQKLLGEGAPDFTDQEAEADWDTCERTWRGWLQAHPRHRFMHLRPPDSLEATAMAQAAPSLPAGGGAAAPQGPAEQLAHEKLRKARADGDLAELLLAKERAALIPREDAHRALVQALQYTAAALADLPARLAQDLDPAWRDRVRELGRQVASAITDELREQLRKLWHASVPRRPQ